jgi:hypothetical protein
MTQPSDPIAYKRFIDGMAAGFPDYDSGAVVTENQPRAQTSFTALSDLQNGTPAVTGSPVKPMLLEEEWGGTRYIEDLPPYYLPEETINNSEYIADAKPDIEYPSIIEPPLVIESVNDIDRTSVYEPVLEIAENNFEPEQKQLPGYITETLEEPGTGEFDKRLEYAIITAEERPPETSKTYDIDLNYIIPGITRPSPAVIPPETIEIPVIAPIPATPPARSFTINPISRLERGSYYVQIASLSGLELVESAMEIINVSVKLGGENLPNYQPKVYKDDGSWYRILLGPLNQGESGAILQRFKSIGYKDSFVRQGK